MRAGLKRSILALPLMLDSTILGLGYSLVLAMRLLALVVENVYRSPIVIARAQILHR